MYSSCSRLVTLLDFCENLTGKAHSYYIFCLKLLKSLSNYYNPPPPPTATKLGGYIGFTLSVCLSVCRSVCLSVCMSVCLSVCPSVCLLTFRVRPAASTVQDGFFPYLVQMINSMRGCVACDDPWPWPISSRSFGLDLENFVRSVASTVLDGFLLYLAQILSLEGVSRVTFFSEYENLNFWQIFKKISALTLKKKIYSSQWILSIFSTNDHWYERVCCI